MACNEGMGKEKFGEVWLGETPAGEWNTYCLLHHFLQSFEKMENSL